ncbi:MAG: hypothetical protein ACTSXD_02045 [Candidatus Heimdallarchaeaceae archaeon]
MNENVKKLNKLVNSISEDLVSSIENFIKSSMAGGHAKKSDDLLDQAKKVYRNNDEFTVDKFRQAWKNLMNKGAIKRTSGGCILNRD